MPMSIKRVPKASRHIHTSDTHTKPALKLPKFAAFDFTKLRSIVSRANECQKRPGSTSSNWGTRTFYPSWIHVTRVNI
eukprot:4575156-Amphidinium_carterae.1